MRFLSFFSCFLALMANLGNSNIFYTLFRFNTSIAPKEYMRVSSSWVESNNTSKKDLFNADTLSLSYTVGPYFPLDSLTFNFINLDKMEPEIAQSELDCFLLSKNNSFVKCSFFSNPTVSYRGISSLEEISEFSFPKNSSEAKSLNKIIDNSESSSTIYLDHSLSFKFKVSENNYFVFLFIVFVGSITSLVSFVWFCLNLFRCIQLTSENRRLKEATNREEKASVKRSLIGEAYSQEDYQSHRASFDSNESGESRKKNHINS